MIRCQNALRHTAFNTKRIGFYCPYLREYFNVLEAAGFVISHRISSFFLYWARGPPSQDCNQESCEFMEVAMWQRNNGETEAEKLQNRFTSYLLVAVRRQQRDYILKKNQQERLELLA